MAAGSPENASQRSSLPGFGRFVAVLAVIVGALVLLTYTGLWVQDAIRAFVAGESLWAKAQKEATYHLHRYVAQGDRQDLRRFQQSIAVPLADRVAREELARPRPDMRTVREALVAGRNHPEDVADMARLVRWFGGVGHIRRSVEIWEAGDALIQDLVAVAEEARAAHASEAMTPSLEARLDRDIDRLNATLTVLEEQFSLTMGEGARWVRRLMTGATVATALLLLWAGIHVERRLLKELRASHQALLEREQQLLEARKLEAVGKLAGGVAHDFHNLLTVVKGNVHLALASAGEGDPLRAELLAIDQAADRAARLTAQLLAFSRQQMLRPRLVDLAEFVREREGRLREELGQAVDLSVDAPSDPVSVRVDPRQLEEVLLCLASNARDAMAGAGAVRVTVRTVELDAEGIHRPRLVTEAEACALLSVEDTGPGMDAETLARAFEPFFTTKDVGRGTGLGLSTVYGVVRQSGGDVRAESAAGRGCAFHVYLPLSASGTWTAVPAVPPPADPSLRLSAAGS